MLLITVARESAVSLGVATVRAQLKASHARLKIVRYSGYRATVDRVSNVSESGRYFGGLTTFQGVVTIAEFWAQWIN